MGVMLWFIGIDKVLDAIKLANPIYILLAILLQVITYFLYTFRWEFILKSDDKKFPLKQLLPMVLLSLAVNNITPSGRGGGEPVRAYLLSNESEETFSQSFATVVTDRALDTVPFILLAIITIISLIYTMNVSPIILAIMIIAVILIVVVVAIIIFMSINEKFGIKVTNWITKIALKTFKKRDPEHLKTRIQDSVTGFQSTMRTLTTNKRLLAIGLPLSILIWAMEILRVYVVFLAFGCTVSPFLVGEIFIVSSLVGMIPLLPGGLGAIDGFMIILYRSSGISASISAASTVIERLISFWMTTIIGLLIVPKYGADIFDKIYGLVSNKEDKEQN